MKRKYLFLSAIALICIAIACRKNGNGDVSSNNTFYSTLFGRKYQATNYSTKTINLNVTPKKISSGAKTTGQSYTSINIIQEDMDSTDFYNFVGAVGANISGAYQNVQQGTTVQIVLYLTGSPLTTNYSIVSGLSSFNIRTDNYYDHTFFYVANTQSTQNTSYSARCSKRYLLDFEALMSSAIPASTCNTPTILIVNLVYVVPQVPTDVNLAPTLINSSTPPQYMQVMNGGGSGCSNCGDDGTCDESSKRECDGGGCLVINTNNNNNPSSYPLSVDSGHIFRDSFLAQYSLGQTYTKYYYYISYFAFQLPTPNNLSIAARYNFALSCYQVAYELQYGASTDVIITPAFKTSALQTISLYRQYTRNTEFQGVLNNISDDLDTYQNVQKATLIQSL